MPARPLRRLLAPWAIVVLLAPVASATGDADCMEVPVANDRCPTWVVRRDVPDPGGGSGNDETYAVAASDGRLFVAGSTPGGSDVQVLALAPATGDTLWSTTIAEARTGAWIEALTVAPDGDTLYLVGGTPDGDVLVVAIDPATGDVRWTTAYDGPAGGSDWPYDLAVAPDSDQVYVAGRSEARAGDLVLLSLSASDGELGWTVRYRSPAGSDGWDRGHAVEVSPDGRRVFVAGRSNGHSSVDLVTLAYDVPGEDEEPSPTWAWVRRFIPYTNAGLSARVGMDVSGDGSRVVISGEGFNNFWTIAYDAGSGQQLWLDELHGTEISDGWAGSVDESIVEISGDRVFVAVSKALDPGPLLASYDLESGAKAWEWRNVTGPPLESATMVLAPGGDTVYALASTLDAGYGASVTAFDAATGSQRWVGRLNEATDHIFGNDLAVSPSGDRLFATGSIRPLDYEGLLDAGTEDYLTWSYRT